MNPLVEQFFDALDEFPQAAPDKMIQTYLGAAWSKNDQEARHQLTILRNFLDTQVAPNDIDRATVLPCKRMAERMVKAGIWTEGVLGQFALWPPESDVTH
jgi:hypothetical protein